MRNPTIAALALSLAVATCAAASAEQNPGIRYDSAVTRQAVADHLNGTASRLQVAFSPDATDARLIVSAQRAYDLALNAWMHNDYVPAEDYAKAADVLLGASASNGGSGSDEAYGSTERLVASLNPASALWLNAFARDLYDRAVSARANDPRGAALDLSRAEQVARASQYATLATSGAPAEETAPLSL